MQFLNRRAIAAYSLVFGFVVLMTGCGGGGSSSDKKAAATVTQVVLFPSPSISLQPGEVSQLQAAALNVNGGQVFTTTITFSSSNPAIQIGVPVGAPSGQALLCAGRWDNLTNPVVCYAPGTGPDTPPNPPPDPPVGAATPISSNITASAAGVTSPITVASIHVPIASLTITPQITPPLSSIPSCISEGQTQIYTAVAKDAGGNTILGVGTINWQSQNTNVATIPASGDTGETDQATATAVHPGQTNIIASIGTISPIASTPAIFKQCLVGSIEIKNTVPNPAGNDTDFHFEIATAATRAMIVTVKDTNGATLTTLPSLSWNSTQPSIAGVGSTGSVNGIAPGVVGISASCLPNNCNSGTNVIVTSNLVSGTVTGTAPTSATAYVTCTDPLPSPADATHTCTTQPSSTSNVTQTQLFPINGTTLGTAINLAHTPTSMVMNRQNSKIYLGSTAGLMIVDANANSFTGTVQTAPGDVLAVAPNGNAVVVSNTTDVFLYNGSTVQTLLNGANHILGAKAAAFSPDGGKLIVATSAGQVWFEIAGATPTFQSPGGSFIGAAFFPSGSLQAASAAGTTQLFAIDPANTSAGSVGCGGLVQPLPNVDSLYAADPGAGSVCVIDNSPAANPFAIGAFTAKDVLIDPSGTLAYLAGGSNSVKVNTIGSTTVGTIPLTNGDVATTGGITTNGTVYVGANLSPSSGAVHVISAGASGTDSATPIATTIPADLVVTKK
jgi:hypothetical protein